MFDADDLFWGIFKAGLYCGSIVVAVILAVILVPDCGSNYGDEGQECFPNHTCMGDLECRSNVCVQ